MLGVTGLFDSLLFCFVQNLLALCKDGKVDAVKVLLEGNGDIDVNIRDKGLRSLVSAG